MEIRSDRGWIKAGLAVLVTGLLGGGVLAAAGGSKPPRKVTAEGKTGQAAPADKPFDLGGPAPAGAAQAPTADPKVGEKVLVGDDGGSVTVSAVEDNVSAGRLFGAGEGNKYIAAEVKGCSGPNEEKLTFEPSYFLLRLDDGTMRDPGAAAKKPSLDGGTVSPGKCLSGWVTFTVPEGALPTGVIYDGSSRLTWTFPLPKNAKQTTTTTMKAGATTSTTADDAEDRDGTKATTSSTKPKSTSTTGKSTATTARSGSTAKSTTTTGKASSSSTTGKSSGSTTTTSKSGSGSTTSTSSDNKSSGSTTSTTGKSPATLPGQTTSTTTDEG